MRKKARLKLEVMRYVSNHIKISFRKKFLILLQHVSRIVRQNRDTPFATKNPWLFSSRTTIDTKEYKTSPAADRLSDI
jgi:hypothetical protein